MNTMPERDVFEVPTDIIVWASSQTWQKQEKLLREKEWNVISTGSRSTEYNFWVGNQIIRDATSLPLKDKASIIAWINGDSEKNWIEDVTRDILTFWKPVDITLHAMSMSGMSHTYPQDVTSALIEANAKISSVLYISYEDAYRSDNTWWSHVFYPVREVKQNMEESALNACKDAKIVDLITFDSPSAKALGFTFLGIVWDFVNFLEAHPKNSITQKFSAVVKDFLWGDYQGIMDLFNQYPIRWELSEGQQSMKQMAKEGTLNAMISTATKNINFAKFSRISWVITDLYLLLAMNDLNENRSDILNASWDRVLLDWERISKQDIIPLGNKIDELFDDLVWITSPESTPIWQANGLYREVTTGLDVREYEFDINNIDFLSNHFGILPLFMMHDMVKNSGLLWKNEYIKIGKPKSMTYSYNNISIVKFGNKISLINTDNPRELFCEFTIWNDSQQEIPESETNGFTIPESEKQKNIDPSCFPHSINWGRTFLNTIPNEFNGISFNRSSALIEHLWFQIANLLLNNPNGECINSVKQTFKRMDNFDASQIWWKFSKAATLYQNPDLDTILWTGLIPTIRIVKASFGMWKLNIILESLDDNNKIIAKHQFVFD